MKRFSFGNDEIVYDDHAEICIQYMKICNNQLDCLKDFRAYLEGVEDVGKMLATAPSLAQKYIDQALAAGIEFLLNFKIYEYNVDRLKKENGDLNYIYSKGYLALSKDYKILCEQNQQYEAQKQFERNNRSRWQGGGFGFRGAIKGAIKAGVMNMATDAVRGIGDSIYDAADSRAFERKVKEGTSGTIEILVSELEGIIMWSILDCILEILETGIHLDASIIRKSSFERAESILSNFDRIGSWGERRNMLKTLLEKDVTVNEVFEYLLKNSFSLGVEWKDAVAITGWAAPRVLSSCRKKEIFSAIDVAQGGTVGNKEAHDLLLRKAIQYEYIDESRNRIPQDSKLDSVAANFVLLALTNLELQMQAKAGEKIVYTISHATIDELEKLYNNILSICKKNHMVNSGDNWKISVEYENLNKSLSYHGIAATLKALKKEYEKACTADGRKFPSIKAVKIYMKESKEFTDIYIQGESYADYESLKLQACVERLETIEFLDPVLSRRRNDLRQKLTILKEHEESDNYKRGMQLKEEFQNKEVGHLFGYGDSGFLEKAYKAARCSQVAKVEAQPYVLMVYDKSEKGSIKGIVLTESYLYNLMGLMMTGNSKVLLEGILSMVADNNMVQIVLKDNKIIKWKFGSEVPIETIVQGLKKGLHLKEAPPELVTEKAQLQKEREELKIQQDKMKEKEQMASKLQEELERRKVRGITYETIEEADKVRAENAQIDYLKDKLRTTKSQKKRRIILSEFSSDIQTADVQNRYQQIKDKVNQGKPKSILFCRILGISLICAFILVCLAEGIAGMEGVSFAAMLWLAIGFWVWLVWKIVLIIKKFSPKHYLNIKHI